MQTKEGQIRIPSGCAIAAIMDKRGRTFTGDDIIKSIALMHDRSNGLGGGFAAYGIYPEYRECFAFHVFYDSEAAKAATEEFLNAHYDIQMCGVIPTTPTKGIGKSPKIWRYFATPNRIKLDAFAYAEEEYTAQCVIKINDHIDGAYVFSSGKNMGAFKAVGYPEDVGEYYMLPSYKAYLWTAHGRFPTNTPGWWGGAHPFTLLDWSIVHNGEISSYDANRRYVEMFGYKCSLQTDTEVITYLFDLLVRKHGLSLETAATVLAAPDWDVIDKLCDVDKQRLTALRATYSGALVNGPFSVILGFNGGLVALNDRLKLRALMAAEDKDKYYFASEESAIRVVCPNPDRVWSVGGGEPVVLKIKGVSV